MWHDIIKNPKDLPAETRMYLVRYDDGAMAIRYFIKKASLFVSNDGITAWTNCFQVPDTSCAICDKAHWQNLSGCMCYTCDTAFCTAADSDDPFTVPDKPFS